VAYDGVQGEVALLFEGNVEQVGFHDSRGHSSKCRTPLLFNTIKHENVKGKPGCKRTGPQPNLSDFQECCYGLRFVTFQERASHDGPVFSRALRCLNTLFRMGRDGRHAFGYRNEGGTAATANYVNVFLWGSKCWSSCPFLSAKS
jgi:hypothetical protein